MLNQMIDNGVDIRVCHLFVTNHYPYTYFERSPPPLTRVQSQPQTLSSLIAKLMPRTRKRKDKRKATCIPEHPTDVVQTALSNNPHQSIEGLMHDSVHTILSIVAPSLTTLSLGLKFDFLRHDIPPMPALTELTLYYYFDLRIHAIARVLRALKPLQALRRLDLVGLPCHAKPRDTLLEAARIAPNLTHICLPVVRAAHFSSMYSTFVGLSVGDMPRSDTVKVYMHLDPWSERAQVFSSREDWDKRWRAFRDEVEKQPDLLALVVRENEMDECYQEQEENWLDRLNGRRGRWLE